jgi:hypothetical protein
MVRHMEGELGCQKGENSMHVQGRMGTSRLAPNFPTRRHLNTYCCVFRKHNPGWMAYLIQEVEESAP